MISIVLNNRTISKFETFESRKAFDWITQKGLFIKKRFHLMGESCGCARSSRKRIPQTNDLRKYERRNNMKKPIGAIPSATVVAIDDTCCEYCKCYKNGHCTKFDRDVDKEALCKLFERGKSAE